MKDFEIKIQNSDGSLKSKEDFLKEMEELYTALNEDAKEQNQFMDLFVNPEVIYNSEEVLDKYHFLERKLYLNTEILPETGRPILEKIQFWNSEDSFDGVPVDDRIPIQLYIDTPGGDLTTSLQIMDAIKLSETPVWTIVTGTAYSGGFFISIAGSKRMAYPSATFLFHEGCAALQGDAHKVGQQADFYKKYQLKQLKQHVLSSTKIPKNLYAEHEKDDWYFGTTKALELGVVDEICKDVNGGLYINE